MKADIKLESVLKMHHIRPFPIENLMLPISVTASLSQSPLVVAENTIICYANNCCSLL